MSMVPFRVNGLAIEVLRQTKDLGLYSTVTDLARFLG